MVYRLTTYNKNLHPGRVGLLSCNKTEIHTYIVFHWGQVMHISISNITIIGSDNCLSPGWHQCWIIVNSNHITNFSETISEIHRFSFEKIHSKISSVKGRPVCLSFNVLTFKYQSDVYIHNLDSVSGVPADILAHNYTTFFSYPKISNTRRTKSPNLDVSRLGLQLFSCNILKPSVLSWEWRCSWSSVNRRCSNYIWVINNLVAY